MTTTRMSDRDVAKWFLCLNLYGTLDMAYVKSVLNTETLTDAQLASLTKCVDALKMRDRVNKFDTENSKCFLADEVEFDEDFVCCATNTILDDVNFVITNKKYYSVDAWKIAYKAVKPKTDKQAKPKIKMSELS